MLRQHRWLITLLAIVLAVGTAQSAKGSLTDIAGHWSAPLVAALQAKGILSGDPEGRFQPDAQLTRAQMSRMLVSSLGNDAEARLLAAHPSRFIDIQVAHWAKGYIETLAESAVTEGYPDGRFGPDDIVTRAQMVVFLVRAAGLAEQVTGLGAVPTTYTDDDQIPEWARGAIVVAHSLGLMAGFEDGSFRPLQPISRAEGSTAIARMLGFQGGAYHLTGTLLWLDSTTGRAAVRDERGREREVTMSRDARYYRSGLQVMLQQVQPLDQVWIVLGADGTGQFMDARYSDRMLMESTVEGGILTTTLPDGTQQQLQLQVGALLFLNGKPVTQQQLAGSLQRAYIMVDRITGEIRVLDGVRASVQGIVNGYDASSRTLLVSVGEQGRRIILTPEASLFLNGRPVRETDLAGGDRVLIAVDAAGYAIYLHAER